MGGVLITLALSITLIYNTKISFAFRVCAIWIFSQRSHLVSLDLEELSVSQSPNYPAKSRSSEPPQTPPCIQP